ncbi:hypothetical protein PENTCL1PPCAC_22645 [Pristionchus entomophagus]|uniref:CHCH domain-containing protein n=1 Tax=Pristionchus entomophagus TaxID=358040 RepID=A0AAV5U1T8_9BILA|nr:hypothetical protein PENTCL1PPCAC_22645 [Pristionchus entomophagus]
MSQAGPFQRVNTVSPPLKGSFPLDHEGACKYEMLKYMCCLHEKNQQNTECRELAKQYFSCRMDKGLMEKDEWHKLGYADKKVRPSNSNLVAY